MDNAKIERKYMAHYINAKLPGAPADVYIRIGRDLEEYSPSLGAQIDKTSNILGETSVKISSYEKQGSVEPLYAERGDPLFERLQGIIDGSLALDDVVTDVVEVKLWEPQSGGGYPAVREKVFIEVTSYGGDTTGYQIPFNIHYTGQKTNGAFDVTAGAFTAD
ncbi:MAG: hypothetical protein FWH06_07305 [Oscillospiraceae bacterium]|nr:hypothetical protein [Oscillospiraceae bacterium]